MNRRGAALTATMLLACWPAWALGGWIVDVAGLIVLDLPIRLGCVMLMLNLAGERLERLLPTADPAASPAAPAADQRARPH